MTDRANGTFYGWFVVMGCSLVALGTAGTQFSFGVFLQPMTEEFGWSREHPCRWPSALPSCSRVC